MNFTNLFSLFSKKTKQVELKSDAILMQFVMQF